MPNEAAPASHGKHCYQKGDTLTGTVCCINVDGVYLDYGDLNALIPVLGAERPRSPMTPPRDRPKKGDGGRNGSPERFEEEEDLMVYDDDTRAVELLSEAVSYMSDGKPDVARAEGEPIFKLIRLNGDDELKDSEWCSWTSGMLSLLELHDVVKTYGIPLNEIEEWTSDLRIWYHNANLEVESDSKKGKKRPLEKESKDDAPVAKVVPETSETRVNVDDELRKVKKKRKSTATEDPYTLLVPKPKKRPANMDRSEKGESSSKAVVSSEEKASPRTKTGSSAGKTQKKEKSQSPKKKGVAQGKDPEAKDRPSEVEAKASATVDSKVAQSCKAIEDARREGAIASIQRCLVDPVLTVPDMEHIFLRLHLSIAANRENEK